MRRVTLFSSVTVTHDFEVEPLDLLVRGLLPLPLRLWVVRLQLLVLLSPSAAVAVDAARLVPPAEQRPQDGGGEAADGRHLAPSHYFLEAEQMNIRSWTGSENAFLCRLSLL